MAMIFMPSGNFLDPTAATPLVVLEETWLGYTLEVPPPVWFAQSRKLKISKMEFQLFQMQASAGRIVPDFNYWRREDNETLRWDDPIRRTLAKIGWGLFFSAVISVPLYIYYFLE